jgi:hypothetical protein
MELVQSDLHRMHGHTGGQAKNAKQLPLEFVIDIEILALAITSPL